MALANWPSDNKHTYFIVTIRPNRKLRKENL